MKNKLNLMGILFVSILLATCSGKKETFNLEKQLSKADYVKLKMKKMPSGHLHLLGKLNGINGNFILDTGAGATVIEEKNKGKFKLITNELRPCE